MFDPISSAPRAVIVDIALILSAPGAVWHGSLGSDVGTAEIGIGWDFSFVGICMGMV